MAGAQEQRLAGRRNLILALLKRLYGNVVSLITSLNEVSNSVLNSCWCTYPTVGLVAMRPCQCFEPSQPPPRLLYLWIRCAYEGVILGDSKAANWGCLVGSTDLENSPIVMLDLRSVYTKSPEKLHREQMLKHVRSLMTSFPGAPKELPIHMVWWWQENTKQSSLPSMIAARKIQDGLVNESGTFKPTVLQSQDDEVVAAHLGLTMEEWENFPKRDAFIEASTVTAL